jgi:hypothetical protein
MKKSIAILACLAVAPLNFVHAGDRFNRNEANGSASRSNYTPDEADGSKSISMLTPDEAEAAKGISMLVTNGVQLDTIADHDGRIHPTMTNDPTEFQRLLPQDQAPVHVDFSTVAGQTAPFIAGSVKEKKVAIYGELQKPGQMNTAGAVTSYEDMPATYWFGQQAEPTFVLANGSVQIVFQNDVGAISLAQRTFGDNEKLMPEQGGASNFGVTLLDSEGLLVGQQSIQDSQSGFGPEFLGVISDKPFRSAIISNTSTNWMFSDLKYEGEASVAK